eukprot:612044-Prorocentrum_minimum.AAC.4
MHLYVPQPGTREEPSTTSSIGGRKGDRRWAPQQPARRRNDSALFFAVLTAILPVLVETWIKT